MPSPVNSVMLSGYAVNMPRRSDRNTRLVTFRMASTQTWWDGTRWNEKDTVYIDVQCWRNLAQNVLTSVVKGMPVIVSGELTLFEYVPEEGPVDRNNQPVKQRLYRLRADSVGTDMNWAQVIRWVKRTGDKDAMDTPAAADAANAPNTTVDSDLDRASSTVGVGSGTVAGEGGPDNGFDRAFAASVAPPPETDNAVAPF